MSATTPRYGITYPTGSDLVSQAPTQFESMADTIETALANVDDRQTANAVKPVVRTTLAQLQEASGVTGQTGYVTDDGANKGVYVYDGGAWARPNGPVTLWTGSLGKTGTANLSAPRNLFSTLRVKGNTGSGYRSFDIDATISSPRISWVEGSISDGSFTLNLVVCSLGDQSLTVTSQRIKSVEGSTQDATAITITEIRGII